MAERNTVFISMRAKPSTRRKLAADALRAGHENVSLIARIIIEQHYRTQENGKPVRSAR